MPDRLARRRGLVRPSGMPSSDDGSAKTPVRTRPLDDAQQGAWFDGPDDVTALRVYDGDVQYELPPKSPRST
jgi:hypothetical protein